MDNSILSESISASSEQITMQERLAILLAFVAGFVDAMGIIKWKTYVSFMSGNTTQLGTAIYADRPGVISISVKVIGCFLLGIYAGTCLSLRKRLSIQTLPFMMVAGLLILYTIASYYFNIATILSIAIIGFSIGMMNTIVTAIGNQKVNTDFVTGTLNSLARNTAMLSMAIDKTERKAYKANVIHLLLVWMGFLSGAAATPFALLFLVTWILAFPALLLMMCALLISVLNFKP